MPVPTLPEPTGVDKELFDAVADILNHCAQKRVAANVHVVKTLVERALAAGAHIGRSCALHCASEFGDVPVIHMLLDLSTNPDDIHSLDTAGLTPLMCAAKSVDKFEGQVPPAVQALLARGASTDTTNSRGRTAYGFMLQGLADVAQFATNFGLPLKTTARSKLLNALVPHGGLTDADRLSMAEFRSYRNLM